MNAADFQSVAKQSVMDGQLELMTREILSFTACLGRAEVIYRCDNEPTMRQLLKYVVSTRLSMGLPTRSVTPPAYSHGNSLVENVIGRPRPLASGLDLLLQSSCTQ